MPPSTSWSERLRGRILPLAPPCAALQAAHDRGRRRTIPSTGRCARPALLLGIVDPPFGSRKGERQRGRIGLDELQRRRAPAVRSYPLDVPHRQPHRGLFASLWLCLWAVVALCSASAQASLTMGEPDLHQAADLVQPKLAEDGCFFLRARWMDPNTGRFVSEDPYLGGLESPVSQHRFLYANGGPIDGVDPSGNMTLSMQMMGIAGLGILATMPTLQYSFAHRAPLEVGLEIDFGEINREILELLISLSNVTVTGWNDAISMYRAEMKKAQEEAERRRKKKGTRYDLLVRGPSSDNGALKDNWGRPDQVSARRWYMEGGPSGRIKGIGLWAPKSGIGSHIEIGEFDNHPIKGDPIWGPDKWRYVYHFHIGPHSNHMHYVIGGVP